MSHHYSGPTFGFPHGDARLDFTDLYAFPKPGDASKSILIMNVHPAVGVNPPGPTTDVPFAPEAIYELRIDTNADAVADIAYRVRFTSSEGGAQTATLRRVEGAQAAGIGDDGQVILAGAPVSIGPEARVTEAGGYLFFAGWRSDPFYFDVDGALNNLQFTGKDYFADQDVCSIVLEVPNPALGPKKMGLWARTVDGASGKWVQADRGARSNQTPFLAGEANADYLAAEPAGDARFITVFAHALEHTGGYTSAEATRVAGTMLPDVLPYDPTRPASYPVNGRALTDDVVDFFLPLLTNGKVTQDKVGPHRDLLAAFPYVGAPHIDLLSSLWPRRKRSSQMANAEKTVIVTGGSQGIGAGLVMAFLQRGYNVVANSRNITKSGKFATSDKLALVDGSIAEATTAANIAGVAKSKFGSIDALVNNAGIYFAKHFTDYTIDDLRSLAAVNIEGFLFITQFVIKQMLAQNTGGSIVNLSTAQVNHPIAGVNSTVPMITKGGIEAVTRSLAMEYAKQGIRVNAVAPGVVDTSMHENQSKDILKTLQPMGQISHVKDIVDAIVYLTEAGQVTGEVLHVDGGAHVGRW